MPAQSGGEGLRFVQHARGGTQSGNRARRYPRLSARVGMANENGYPATRRPYVGVNDAALTHGVYSPRIREDRAPPHWCSTGYRSSSAMTARRSSAFQRLPPTCGAKGSGPTTSTRPDGWVKGRQADTHRPRRPRRAHLTEKRAVR